MQRTVKDARLIFKPCARYLLTLPSPSLFELPLTIPYPDSLSSYSRLLDSPAVVESVSIRIFARYSLRYFLLRKLDNHMLGTMRLFDRFVKFDTVELWYIYYWEIFWQILFFLILYFKLSEYWYCDISRATLFVLSKNDTKERCVDSRLERICKLCIRQFGLFE